jgi:hypothetical protein
MFVTGGFRRSGADKIGNNQHAISKIVAVPNSPLHADMRINSCNNYCLDRSFDKQLAELLICEGAVTVLRKH